VEKPPPVVELRGVSKYFPGVQALHQVSLEIRAGEVLGLIGENGAGKSTLVKILAGIYKKSAGEILVSGKPAAIEDPVGARRRGLSFILQDRNLVPHLSVQENLFAGRQPAWWNVFVRWKSLRREAQRILDMLHCELEPSMPVSGLSVGQQQLVEIGRALSFDSRVIVMDEPTASISDQEVDVLFDIIRKLRGRGIAVVFISHRLKEVLSVTDRIAVLRDGELVRVCQTRGEDVDSLIRLMVGRDIADAHYQRDVSPSPEVMLSVRNLSCERRFRDVSFDVKAGEILGFAGLVGARRTELLQTLFGYRQPSAGEVYLQGRLATYSSPAGALSAGISYLSENRREDGLFPFLSVEQNITIAALRELTQGGFVDRKREREMSLRYIDSLMIKTSSPGSPVGLLSGGNQQKALIARGLSTRPRVILLDEPTAGIDVGAKFEIYNILADLAAQGVAILLVSSELPELLRLCHRIIVMCQGRVTGEFPIEAATQEAIIARATQFERPVAGTVSAEVAGEEHGRGPAT